MSILKELTTLSYLTEAPIVPIELQKLFGGEVSAKFSQAALHKLWGTNRLVWHGMPFFDGDDLGRAYKMAEDAAKKSMASSSTDVNLEVKYKTTLDRPHSTDFHMSYDIDFSDADAQEVYLGYDAKRDKLYIGFDVHAGEEAFNDAFDAAFKENLGVRYDEDEDEHEKILSAVHKENNRFVFWGMVFEVTDHNGTFSAEEAVDPLPGGFYRDTFKKFKEHHPDVVHLRLD